MSSVLMILICMAGAFMSGWMMNEESSQKGLRSSGSSAEHIGERGGRYAA